MSYVPPPKPDIVCPECGANVRMLASRRGWAGALVHPAPTAERCTQAMDRLSASV